MLQYLNQCLIWRKFWILLILSILLLEVIALWFYYIMLYQPCTMCIYEHCALFGIMIAGLVGFISPKNILIRYIALITWICSAWKGMCLSYEHTIIQLHPYMSICKLTIQIPSWIPFNKWLATVFISSDNCSGNTWSFLTLNMPQWLIVIFSIYFLIALFGLIAQLSTLRYHCLSNR